MIEKIRNLSKERGISLSFVCKKLGVASVYFIDIEKQHRIIPEDKLKIIADTLFTTIDYLKGTTTQKDKYISTNNLLGEREILLIDIFQKCDEIGKMNIMHAALTERDKLDNINDVKYKVAHSDKNDTFFNSSSNNILKT